MSDSKNKHLSLPEGLSVETWFQDHEKSVAFITLHGVNTETTNSGSDTEYEVIDGNGTFHIANNPPQKVSKGSKILASKGTPYYDEGSLVMLATSNPPFNPEDITITPEK